MKATILSIALAVGMCGVVPTYAQSVGDDVKNAGHDTKTATEKGYDKTKTATEKGYDKTTSGVKKGYKKSTHATKEGVHKSADKVADKTSTS